MRGIYLFIHLQSYFCLLFRLNQRFIFLFLFMRCRFSDCVTLSCLHWYLLILLWTLKTMILSIEHSLLLEWLIGKLIWGWSLGSIWSYIQILILIIEGERDFLIRVIFHCWINECLGIEWLEWTKLWDSI